MEHELLPAGYASISCASLVAADALLVGVYSVCSVPRSWVPCINNMYLSCFILHATNNIIVKLLKSSQVNIKVKSDHSPCICPVRNPQLPIHPLTPPSVCPRTHHCQDWVPLQDNTRSHLCHHLCNTSQEHRTSRCSVHCQPVSMIKCNE